MSRSSTTNVNNNSSSENRKHIICWSGGKDSTATIILFHEHENELLADGEEVVILYSEVMFDAKKNIPGTNPKIRDFIYEQKAVFESWGYTVIILRANGKYKDFLDFFNHPLNERAAPERIGKKHGFPLTKGMCGVKRELKEKPMKEWLKNNLGENLEYVGLAIDEPRRLESMHKEENKISLLERYGLTEEDARNLCEHYNMLSPQYKLQGQKRDGCWFCPYAKLVEHKNIREIYPNARKKYIKLENEDLAYKKWNPYSKETLHQRDERIRLGYKQWNLFEVFDYAA